jgi:hypothetical protein
MARSTPRQIFNLKEWRSNNPKGTDPHYSGRLLFDRQLIAYLIECLNAEENPEFFVSLWVTQDEGKAALGLAVPVEWINHSNRSTREDFAQWMD